VNLISLLSKINMQAQRLEEKLKNMPMVDLVIADNSIYPEKGKMSIIDGQFDKTTGAISVRAVFPNPNGTLRTGNTGRVRMPQLLSMQ
jgi:membrane fusion protein (multidrug efflux system)